MKLNVKAYAFNMRNIMGPCSSVRHLVVTYLEFSRRNYFQTIRVLYWLLLLVGRSGNRITLGIC